MLATGALLSRAADVILFLILIGIRRTAWEANGPVAVLCNDLHEGMASRWRVDSEFRDIRDILANVYALVLLDAIIYPWFRRKAAV